MGCNKMKLKFFTAFCSAFFVVLQCGVTSLSLRLIYESPAFCSSSLACFKRFSGVMDPPMTWAALFDSIWLMMEWARWVKVTGCSPAFNIAKHINQLRQPFVLFAEILDGGVLLIQYMAIFHKGVLL